MYREIVRSCPETWLRPVQNFSSFAFTKPQLLDFASVGANRGKKKKEKTKKNRFDVSTFQHFPRFPRGSLETKRKTDYIHVLSVAENTFPRFVKVVIEKKKKNWVGKISTEILVPPARRSWVEERNKGKRRERENRKGMILDTTTRQIFATSSRASIIPRPSTRYQRSLIDLSPRKKREREEHRWWNFWNQLPGSEMAR